MAVEKKLLEELRVKLEAEKKALKGELSQIAEPTENPEDYKTNYDNVGTDRDENASEVEEYSDNLALEDNLEKQLKEVDGALKRIADGTYGFCENCGQEISVDRLRAYPAARTCIQCK